MDGLRSFFGAKTQHAKPAANKKPATTPEAKTQTQAVKIPRPQVPVPAPVKATPAPATPAINARPQTNRPAPAPQAARTPAKPTPPPKPITLQTREMTAAEFKIAKAEILELHNLLIERDAIDDEIAKNNNDIIQIRLSIISDLQTSLREMESILQKMDNTCDYHVWYIEEATNLHQMAKNDLSQLQLKGNSTTARLNEYDMTAKILIKCDSLRDAADLELKLKYVIDKASQQLELVCKEANDVYDQIVEKDKLSELFKCASGAINNLSDLRANLPAFQNNFNDSSTLESVKTNISESLKIVNSAFSMIDSFVPQ